MPSSLRLIGQRLGNNRHLEIYLAHFVRQELIRVYRALTLGTLCKTPMLSRWSHFGITDDQDFLAPCRV